MFTPPLETTTLCLHCHWRLLHFVYTVTGDYYTLFTPPLETTTLCLHRHWRLLHFVYTATGDYYTLFTLPLETTTLCLHCHRRLLHLPYSDRGTGILLSLHYIFCCCMASLSWNFGVSRFFRDKRFVVCVFFLFFSSSD